MISIPYGSIKSCNQVPCETHQNKFQFLMVQLKVTANRLLAAVFIDFNSLWFN